MRKAGASGQARLAIVGNDVVGPRKPLVAALTKIAKLAGHISAISEHGGASRKKTAELSQRYLASACVGDQQSGLL